jgi:hypothetical protein
VRDLDRGLGAGGRSIEDIITAIVRERRGSVVIMSDKRIRRDPPKLLKALSFPRDQLPHHASGDSAIGRAGRASILRSARKPSGWPPRFRRLE